MIEKRLNDYRAVAIKIRALKQLHDYTTSSGVTVLSDMPRTPSHGCKMDRELDVREKIRQTITREYCMAEDELKDLIEIIFGVENLLEQNILINYYLLGKKLEEVAKEMNVCEKTVKNKKNNVMETLKRKYN